MTSFAGGARGLLYPRWRPLLDGPLFGAFGAYGMDGSRTARSEMASRIAKWANAPEQADLWRSQPVRGDIGIVFIPETQVLDYALQGKVDTYTAAMRGAYQGFFAHNIQADFVHIDHIGEYAAVYLPYPIMMTEASARKLVAFVHAGGRLISEGLPAYFGERGHVGQVQPNYGLDALFGARQADVVFAPDLFGELALEVMGERVVGGAFRQTYELAGGTAAGAYDDGAIAAVQGKAGKGETLLVGTFPSIGFATHHAEGTRAFFRRVLGWAGLEPSVATDNAGLTARLHDGEGGRHLFVLNPARSPQSATLTPAPSIAPVAGVRVHWGDPGSVQLKGASLAVTVGARDALVVRLD
jgi:beta-galactosidase